jgi:tRNA G10  N-methylase Trm11
MSRRNVAHFGYETQIDRADARDWSETADAVVTDLPYGRGLEVSEEDIRGIVAGVMCIAPVAVFVAGEDISSWLRDAGYGRVETYRVPKTRAFRRYIHRAWSDGCRD